MDVVVAVVVAVGDVVAVEFDDDAVEVAPAG